MTSDANTIEEKINDGICPTCGNSLEAREISEGSYISALRCDSDCGFVLWSSKLHTEWFKDRVLTKEEIDEALEQGKKERDALKETFNRKGIDPGLRFKQ